MNDFVTGDLYWKDDKKQEVIFVPKVNGKFKMHQNKTKNNENIST